MKTKENCSNLPLSYSAVFPLTMAQLQDKVYCVYFSVLGVSLYRAIYLKCRFSRDRDQG